MALTQGSKVLYSDFNAVKTSVDAAYRKTKGSTPSWSNAPTAAGQVMRYAALSQLNSNGSSANSSFRTVSNSTYFSRHGTGGSTGQYVLYNYSHKTTYYTGNNKCGGVVTYGLASYSKRRGGLFGQSK